jgi:hypothetical protein
MPRRSEGGRSVSGDFACQDRSGTEGCVWRLPELGFMLELMPQGEFEFGGGDGGDEDGVAAGWP